VEAQEIEALAMVGAAAIVSAMATDAWNGARERIAELLRQHSPARRAELETRLEANAAQVERAGDVERARGALVGSWQLELEEVLSRNPDAAEDLVALTDRIRASLPTASAQWVQNITAHGNGVVNAVQHGTQHNHFMDAAQPQARPSTSSAGGENG
jgi:hypothetical protein